MTESTLAPFRNEHQPANLVGMLSAPMRYSKFYPWYLLVASMDIMLTWVVLTMGGQEVNGIASWALGLGGLSGLIALKFASVVVVVLICETIGPRNEQAGRRLVLGSVAISAVPIAVAAFEIASTIALMNAHPHVQF